MVILTDRRRTDTPTETGAIPTGTQTVGATPTETGAATPTSVGLFDNPTIT